MSKQESKLSIKNRLTIWIKRQRPVSWIWYGAASVLLLISLILIGVFNQEGKSQQVPEELKAANGKFRLTITGDIEISDSLRKLASTSGYSGLVENVASYWADSDYVMANLNGPVLRYDVSHYTATRSQSEEAVYLRPAAVRQLAGAGINLLCFANDDTYNYGFTGIQSTLAVLNQEKLSYLGIVENSQAPLYQLLPYEVQTNGQKQTQYVAVMDVNDVIRNHEGARQQRAGVVNSSMPQLYQEVHQAAEEADCVIVYLHAGEDKGQTILNEHADLAHALVSAGADLVVSTHSDMLQSVERYQKGMIVYGLGDLLSDADFSYALNTVLLDLVIESNGEANVYLTPVRVKEGKAQIASGLYRKQIESLLTDQLTTEDYTITDSGLIRIPLKTIQPKTQHTALSN